MSSENARLNDRPSEPVRIGGLIGLFGGIVGAAAAAIFLVTYLSNFRFFDMPLAIALAGFGQGLVSISLIFVSFVTAALIGWRSTRPKWAIVITGSVQVALGLFLTAMSFLTGFTIGPFIMPGAFLVLLSGVVLVWAAFSEHVRH